MALSAFQSLAGLKRPSGYGVSYTQPAVNDEDRRYRDRAGEEIQASADAGQERYAQAIKALASLYGSPNPNVGSDGPGEFHSVAGPSAADTRDLHDVDPIRRRVLGEGTDEKIREFEGTALPLGMAEIEGKSRIGQYTADRNREGRIGAAEASARGRMGAEVLKLDPSGKPAVDNWGSKNDIPAIPEDTLMRGTQNSLMRGLQQAGPGGDVRAQLRKIMAIKNPELGELSDEEIDHILANADDLDTLLPK